MRPATRGGESSIPTPSRETNFYDYYANELLQSQTYHADGQILDEVYEFASFVQSKMYHKGIRCSDCHDPHALRTTHTGNQVCTSCHQHPAGKYEVVGPSSPRNGVDGRRVCRMPYAQDDLYGGGSPPGPQHSHSASRSERAAGNAERLFAMPPDEGQAGSRQSGHAARICDWLTAARNGDQEVREALARADRWCADKFREWYGTKDDEQTHFAHTLTVCRGDAVAEGGLLTMVKDRRLPAIVRATGLYELSQYNSPAVLDASYELLNDFDPQVRSVAIANLQSWPDESLVRSVVPLLKDRVRSGRTEAARVLAAFPLHC